jgi:hypothetical protein
LHEQGETRQLYTTHDKPNCTSPGMVACALHRDVSWLAIGHGYVSHQARTNAVALLLVDISARNAPTGNPPVKGSGTVLDPIGPFDNAELMQVGSTCRFGPNQ